MSTLCNMLYEMMKDEKKAPSKYEDIKSKIIDNSNRKILTKIQNDERNHYKKVKKIYKDVGCKK